MNLQLQLIPPICIWIKGSIPLLDLTRTASCTKRNESWRLHWPSGAHHPGIFVYSNQSGADFWHQPLCASNIARLLQGRLASSIRTINKHRRRQPSGHLSFVWTTMRAHIRRDALDVLRQNYTDPPAYHISNIIAILPCTTH